MKYTKKQLNQDGIVSIVITLIIMIVLTLIVTGFAQLARREQREALDRQLNAQAGYAAESGINALKKALPNISSTSRTSCDNSVNFVSPPSAADDPFNSTNSNLSDTASYTCLLFNKKPAELVYSSVSSDTSEVIPISVEDPASPGTAKAVETLNITWKNKNGSVGIYSPSNGNFPKFQDWGSDKIGVLRLDVIPADNKTMIKLDESIKTFFLYPKSSGGVSEKQFADIKRGEIIDVACNNGCSFVIQGLDQTKYYVRLRSLYTISQVSLNGASTAGGETTNKVFSGAQVEIDSTGKANDVLKRIKVRIQDPSPSSDKINLSTIPEYVFSSTKDICKQMQIYPGVTGTIPACP